MNGGARGGYEGERGGVDAAGAGPGARGAHAFGDAPTSGAVVDVTDELGSQGAGEQDVAVALAVVAGEPGDDGTVAGLDDGEGGPGALHLAGGSGEQLTGGGRGGAEDGGEFGDAEPVADGEFEGLALLGCGAGGFGPGEPGQLRTAVGAHVKGPMGVLAGVGWHVITRITRRTVTLNMRRRTPSRMRSLARAPLIGQPVQAAPAGECVQPGAPVPLVGAATGVPLGHGEDVPEHVGRGVVVAQDRQAVREQAVQVGLVPERRRLLGPVGRVPVRPVCAGAR